MPESLHDIPQGRPLVQITEAEIIEQQLREHEENTADTHVDHPLISDIREETLEAEVVPTAKPLASREPVGTMAGMNGNRAELLKIKEAVVVATAPEQLVNLGKSLTETKTIGGAVQIIRRFPGTISGSAGAGTYEYPPNDIADQIAEIGKYVRDNRAGLRVPDGWLQSQYAELPSDHAIRSTVERLVSEALNKAVKREIRVESVRGQVEGVAVGDALVDKKTKERIELNQWVPDENHPEGGQYTVKRTSIKGIVYDYSLTPNLVKTMMAGPRYDLQHASGGGPEAKPTPSGMPSIETAPTPETNAASTPAETPLVDAGSGEASSAVARPDNGAQGLEASALQAPLHISEDMIEESFARRESYQNLKEKDSIGALERKKRGKVKISGAPAVSISAISTPGGAGSKGQGAEDKSKGNRTSLSHLTAGTIYTDDVLNNPKLDTPTPLTEEASETPIARSEKEPKQYNTLEEDPRYREIYDAIIGAKLAAQKRNGFINPSPSVEETHFAGWEARAKFAKAHPKSAKLYGLNVDEEPVILGSTHIKPAENLSGPAGIAEQQVEAELHPKFKIGDRVFVGNLTGGLIFPEPVVVERIDSHNGKMYYVFEGYRAGMPEDQIVLAMSESEPTAPGTGEASQPDANEVVIDADLAGTSNEKPENLATAEKDYIESLPPTEKKTLIEGLANLGFSAQGFKAKIFHSIFAKLSQVGVDKSSTVSIAESSALRRFITSYAELYNHEKEQADAALQQQGKSGALKASGIASGSGTAMRYGRILYDFAANGSLRYANPFRFATATAMFVGKNAEVAKEARLKSAEVLEATRVAEVDQAYDEAEKIYAKAKEGKDQEYAPTKQELTQTYTRFMPKDLIDRLNRKKGDSWLSLKLAQRIADEDINFSIKHLTKNLDTIEKSQASPEEKQRLSSKILRRQEKFLTDVDRMVSNAGTVDQFAYWGYQMEKAGKHAANILMLNTAYMMAHGVWDHLGRLGQIEHSDSTVPDVIDHEAIPSHSEAPQSSPPVTSAESATEQSLDTRQTADQILHDSVISPLHEAPESVSGAATHVASAGEIASGRIATSEDGAIDMLHRQTLAEQVSTLGIEIHKGEGMIEAAGRTMETQYGLSHERAMALANRVWAEHEPQKWYDLVHSGDTFSVDVHGVTPEMLQTGDIGELAKQIQYDSSHFEAASGLEPAHEVVHHAAAAEPVVEAAPIAPVEVAAVPELSLEEQFKGQEVSPEAWNFLTHHKVAFDPKTMELSYDLNDDQTFSKDLIEVDAHGITSQKTEIFKLGANLKEGVDHVAMHVDDKSGHLIVEAFAKDHVAKEILGLSQNGDVQASHIEKLIITAPTTMAEHQIIEVSPGRFAHKLSNQIHEYTNAIDKQGAINPQMKKNLENITVAYAAGRKGDLLDLLQTQYPFKLSKSDAKSIVKPLHFIFENLMKAAKKDGIAISPTESIASILGRIKILK